MTSLKIFSLILLTCFSILTLASCCDLQNFFSDKRVSVEESSAAADVIFRGLVTAGAPAVEVDEDGAPFIAHFHLVSTYKGADRLLASANTNNIRTKKINFLSGLPDFYTYIITNLRRGFSLAVRKLRNSSRQIDVTFIRDDGAECSGAEQIPVPAEFLVFCVVSPDVVDLIGNGVNATKTPRLRAVSLVRWAELIEQRVWKALGWSDWSDWSPCSVSCLGGIQQRTRRCLANSCPEHNVEQRHCNLFGCEASANPLALDERRYFHPARARWQHVPGRNTAWRLQPNSYIWVPSQQLFTTGGSRFPQEFTLFVTLRLNNDTQMGTIFSLRSRRRQDAYLSLELAGNGGINLVHAAAANGTDVVRIPAKLNDGKWHQLAISVRDDSTVQSYVDCEWLRTDILKKDSLDTPEDSDLIIGYLFTGDLEQMTIVPDSTLVSLQCSPTKTPIIDVSLDSTTPEIVSTPSTEESTPVYKKKHPHHSKTHHKKKKFGSMKKELTDFE